MRTLRGRETLVKRQHGLNQRDDLILAQLPLVKSLWLSILIATLH
jgi:hypothetical protein